MQINNSVYYNKANVEYYIDKENPKNSYYTEYADADKTITLFHYEDGFASVLTNYEHDGMEFSVTKDGILITGEKIGKKLITLEDLGLSKKDEMDAAMILIGLRSAMINKYEKDKSIDLGNVDNWKETLNEILGNSEPKAINSNDIIAMMLGEYGIRKAIAESGK